MARTLDHISGGRAILGIGSGWFERDYREYGYPFGTVQSRLHDFEEALGRIDARLAKLNPGPVNGSLPILIGGSGEKVMLRLVAQHAKIWHAFGDVETIAHKGRVLDEWCAKLDRDPGEIIRSTTLRDAVTPELVRDYVEKAGMHELVASSHGPDYDPAPLRKLVALRDAING
jgi:alkanesulfonate monooxygenase SsuD/methylene tetrahydromethanopterin reductase-like flavin-dependent oxidoreductase (luciferase family)